MKTLKKGDVFQFELLTKSGISKYETIVYYTYKGLMTYTKSAIQKSTDDNRPDKKFITGCVIDGVRYEQNHFFPENNQEQLKFPTRISRNLQKISTCNFQEYLPQKDWVILKIKYKYLEKLHTRDIRVNIDDIINGYEKK